MIVRWGYEYIYSREFSYVYDAKLNDETIQVLAFLISQF